MIDTPKNRAWSAKFIAFTAVVLMWSASYWLVSHSTGVKLPPLSELATLLFGASSIALFLLSLIIAILAIIGWQDVQKRLKHVDDLETQIRIQTDAFEKDKFIPLKNEVIGRVRSLLGFLIGEMSINRESFQARDEDQLREAISLCQQGYELLKEIGGAAEFMALNNLVFYSCVINDLSRSKFLLAQARRLFMAGQEHEALSLLITACRAVLQFSADEGEKREACAVLANILNKPQATGAQKKEAAVYLASFKEFSSASSQPNPANFSKDLNL